MSRVDVVSTEPPLSAAETSALARQVEAGVLARAARLQPGSVGATDATPAELLRLEQQGEAARQRFVRANLGLVAMVTRQFADRGPLSASDLFQEGCVGLMAAVERFDHVRGFRFSTYALYWIRAHVGAAAARQLGSLTLPTSRAEQLRAVRGLEAELSQALGRPARVGDVAEALGRTLRWTEALLAHRPPQSLDAMERPELESLVAPVEEPDDRVAWVRDLLVALPALERQVIEHRVGFADGRAQSLAEVARALRISVTRVRRLEARALDELRAVCPQQASVHL